MRFITLLSNWIGPIALSLVISGLAQAENDHTAQDEKGPCAAADALLAVGELEAAKTEYIKLLTGGDQSGCAVAGLRKTDAESQTKRCTTADALLAAKEFEAAKTEYTELLRGDNKPECAVVGLRKTDTELQTKRCAAADALLAEEYFEAAKTEYTKLLTGDDQPGCAVAGLRKTDTELQTKRCAAADALLAAKEFEAAKTEYIELLKGEIKPECAVVGLRKTDTESQINHCAAADALLAAKEFEAAKTEYTKLLQGDNKPECAVVGLYSAVGNAIARAERLAAFGLHDEASAIVQEELEKDEKMEVPPQLQYLSGGKVPVWREVRRDLEYWARPILEIMVALILVIVMWTLLTRWVCQSTNLNMVIDDFDGGSVEDERLGKGFSSIIRSQLKRISEGSRQGHVSIVTAQIKTIDIPPEVESAVPEVNPSWLSPITWVKAIPALFNWLAPLRTVNLKGYLHKSENRGVGITVQLVDNGKILDSRTLWNNDFDDSADRSLDGEADSFYQLAEYAAVWLVFKTQNNLKLLGTSNWQSYAYFRAGLYAEKQYRKIAAKNLYIRALRLDPNFSGARVNLGSWYIRHEDEDKKHEEALVQLERARKDASDGDQDPTLYSAIYNLAVLQYDNGELKAANKEIDNLIKKIDETLKKTSDKDKLNSSKDKLNKIKTFFILRLRCQKYEENGYLNPALKYHLETIKPFANIMRGGLRVELGNSCIDKQNSTEKEQALTEKEQALIEEGKALIEAEAKISSVFPRTQYNLACSYSILANAKKCHQPESKEEHDKFLQASLSHLDRSFQLHARFADGVEKDRSLTYVREAKPDKFKALVDKYKTPAIEGPES